MGLARNEAGIALRGKSAEKFVSRLLNPGRNVFGRAGIAGENGQCSPDRQRLHAPNKFHQWPRAEAAARINLFINGDFSLFWHHSQLLFCTWEGMTAQITSSGGKHYQMNSVIRPSLARSTKVATPVTSSTIGSMSSSFMPKSSMVMLHA